MGLGGVLTKTQTKTVAAMISSSRRPMHPAKQLDAQIKIEV